MDIYILTPKEGMVHLNLMDKWLDFLKDGLVVVAADGRSLHFGFSTKVNHFSCL